MLLPRTSLGLLALAPLLVSSASQPARRDYATLDYYVLEHDPSSSVPVEEVASALGLELVERAGELRDHWLLSVPKSVFKRDGGDHVLDTLHRLRSLASAPTSAHEARALYDSHRARRVASSVRHVEKQGLRKRTKRDDSHLLRAPPPIPQPADDKPGLAEAAAIAKKFGIRDPIFAEQWHLVNDAYPKNMMNTTPVWESGVTGKGVIAAMVDDGLDFNSDDLAANFVSRLA